MSLLTDEEIDSCWLGPMPSGAAKSRYDIAKALQAALLAKLASAELPEPTVYSHNVQTHMNVPDAYSADQLRQAYAQGAAAQIATCKNCLQVELLLKDMLDTLPYNTPEYWIERIRGALPLYTRRQAND